MSSGRVLATVAVAALATGCRCRREAGDPVAASIAAGVREQLGVAARRVTCTRERCEIELAGGLTIEARVSGDREVMWESQEVLRTAPIAGYVRAELAALGMDAAVDCGPSLVVAAAATRITCTIAAPGASRGSAGGSAWVDVLADGGLSLELALDEETVKARTEPVDPDGLDELSRALDTDEAQGGAAAENDPGDPDPADAGIASDAGAAPGALDATR